MGSGALGPVLRIGPAATDAVGRLPLRRLPASGDVWMPPPGRYARVAPPTAESALGEGLPVDVAPPPVFSRDTVPPYRAPLGVMSPCGAVPRAMSPYETRPRVASHEPRPGWDAAVGVPLGRGAFAGIPREFGAIVRAGASGAPASRRRAVRVLAARGQVVRARCAPRPGARPADAGPSERQVPGPAAHTARGRRKPRPPGLRRWLPDARCSFRRGCRILEVWSSSGTSRSSGRGGRRG